MSVRTLTNINFLSPGAFNTLDTINDNELYFVQAQPLGAPGNQFVDLTLSNDYIAPANGYFTLMGYATASNGWANISVKNAGGDTLLALSTVGPNPNHGTLASLPVQHGQILHHDMANYHINTIRFVYAQGEI